MEIDGLKKAAEMWKKIEPSTNIIKQAQKASNILNGYEQYGQNQSIKIKETMDSIAEMNREEYQRKIKLVEETENTRMLIQEFKEIVQGFISASEGQIETSKISNEIMKNWTRAIGWLTLVMALFTAATLIFTFLTYIK